jgi:unspecific monooxygenase
VIKTYHQDPRDPDFVQNPYSFYESVRESGPFFLWKDYEFLCSVEHKTVNAILRDRRFGREAPEGFAPVHPEHVAPFYSLEKHSLLELEPPNHTRIRGLLVRAFTNRRIAELEPQIEALANDLVANFDNEEIDLLPAFCEKIPIIIIARLLGVPENMAHQMLAWSHDMVAMYQARRDRAIEDAAVQATQAFSAFIREYVDARRNDPRDDLITNLIAANDEGERLSTDELVTTCILLLNAGHEATVHSFANCIRAVLLSGTPPKQTFSTPQKTIAMVEETLRFDPPLHMFTRYAMQNFSAFDHEFKAGDVVGLMLAGANRDPHKFADAGNLDTERGGIGNLSFGAGLHFCIGTPLAKLEMAVALPILFARFPNIKLTEPTIYADRYHFHGLKSLRVNLGVINDG